MASVDQKFKYDVFLSFRGEDTRHGFIGNLWKALDDKGVRTFIDDVKLLKGDEITPSLLKAIDESMMAIVVLSENYASSSFCLQELSKILDIMKDKGRCVLPVFYKVNPSDVRKLKGTYGEAMDKHDKASSSSNHKWKMSLHQVANLSGHHYKGDGNESEFIDKIVEDASRMLHGDPPLHMRREVVKVPLSRTLHKIARVMLSISLVVFQAEMTWRVVGFMSCVVGLLCYALDPSFNRLFGRWNPFKVSLYVVLSLAILTAILKANKASPPTWYVQLKNICITFAVLMIISVYSFFYDRAVNGKPNILSLISNAAFALVSVSLHRLLKFGVEMGVFSYFVGCFTIQLLTINKMLIFVAIIYGFLLFVLHSFMNFPPNVASGRQDHQV